MLITEWVGDDLWNLIKLPNPELYRLYEQYYTGNSRDRRANIRRKANHYRRLVEKGRLKMPERSAPYDPEKEPQNIERRRAKAAMNLAGKALDTMIITVPVEHLPYHEKLQEALQSEGRLDRATFTSGEHTGFIKNSDNEIEYTEPLKAMKARFHVEFDNEPKWLPVNRVESVKLSKREAEPRTEARRAVILSDLQIPFQDEKALEIAFKIIRDVKPDKLVLVGDMLDLSSWSKYIQRPEWATATQEAINQAHRLLVTLRKLCPTAEISVLEGNHDARMEKYALNNAQAAFGLKRADQPDGWPVLSVPYLTAMDNLDIDYVSGYPANRLWINRNLQVRHGNLVRSKSNTAVAVAQEERVSTIFGHIHRLETQYLTHQTYDGGKTIGAWSIGCLCKIDGSVPSTRGGYDLRGNPVQNHENWQNGIAVVDYEEDDGGFSVQPIYIDAFKHRAIYNGRTYGV